MKDLDLEVNPLFTYKSEFDKAIHTLEGLLQGISIDNDINDKEIEELKNWCSLNEKFLNKQPFKDLIPYIIEALEDKQLDSEEKEHIYDLCHYLDNGSQFYDIVTSDLQRLQGILHGIMADNEISDQEIRKLDEWISMNSHLMGHYPYDEISSLILTVLEDQIITTEEKNRLKVYFNEFIEVGSTTTIDGKEIQKLKENIHVNGITTSNPEITFNNKIFCITGKFIDKKRSEVAEAIKNLGGKIVTGISEKVNYLIIGSSGNKCWAYSCYGRKVESAMTLRKKGLGIQIIKEEDFWDAVEDQV